MKTYQVLTQESIEIIERAIIHLKAYNSVIPDTNTTAVIVQLEVILFDVKEN